MIDIDPMVDFACKMVLGNPAHSGLTVHFLNSVLRLPSPIVQVEHLNPIVPPKFETDKLSVLDILAMDDQGRRYNIEVQRRIENSLQERLAYYAATQLVDQISRGQGYRELQPSIGICILKGTLFAEVTDYHQQFRLRTTAGLELTSCLEIHTLELYKFGQAKGKIEDAGPLDDWMDFFCNAKGSDTQSLKQRLGSPIFDEAIGILEMISQNPEQRRKYEARLKFERDQMMYVQAAEARGEARGEAKGKAETIQLLQSLLGMPLQDVNTLMSMPLEELNQINADLVAKLRTREG
jgi:predicted transposase/invertase (TIGR01784 family)